MPTTSLNVNQIDSGPAAFLWYISLFLRKVQLMASLATFFSPLTLGRLKLLKRQLFAFELMIPLCCQIFYPDVFIEKKMKGYLQQNYFCSANAERYMKEKKKKECWW